MVTIVSLIVSSILNWIVSKAAALFAAFKRDKADQAQNAGQAAQDTAKAEKITRDATQAEVTDANDDTLSHF